ncbi:DUF6002 family protein [Streptomyces lunaelactis]|uniref:DUF6002 family protein n=1 Tax=Streptomyces lunaelactis TaxID=1535768 RepID=UPI001584FEC7|nr:DUF6002 family protein [Streptomyces lunaelactis]NUK00708.1 hypothetical protein [Streptomyces lunaelactis]NUK14428.1 hypothetical protein [Streptomyces lunaelactis]NUK21407.1 hypothetical protein [Streptomyces lunaelactis]
MNSTETTDQMQHAATAVVPALSRYWETVGRAVRAMHEHRSLPGDFTPGAELPPLDGPVRRYLEASEAAVARLPDYRETRMRLLDLRRNPGTRTTKTFGSLLMVARAVAYIRRTGEPVTLLTPSSGNKATALRDAVLRAHRAGLADRDQLRIVSVVPERSRAKLWDSPLSSDPELRRRNPVVTYPGPDPAGVKELARAYYDEYADLLRTRYGSALWYTLDIANYQAADTVRALMEAELMPPPPARGRVHAHAVSSAFGLLGHHYGTSLTGGGEERMPPRYFLVQHLSTPDMVLDLLHGDASRERMPRFTLETSTGLYHQSSDPHFPRTTHHPEEVIDPTFYTRAPMTSRVMTPLIKANGGGGVVVSLHECLARYPQIREMLRPAGVELPHDPRTVREWSLVMVFTGVMEAVDRGLLTEPEVLVHGSGSYAETDFSPIPAQRLQRAADTAELHPVVSRAMGPAASHRGRRS